MSSPHSSFWIGIVLSMATQTKRGRKPKGQREAISAKVPTDHKPIYEEAADAAGIPLCDYVAVVMAKHHGLPAPTYLEVVDKRHPELPLGA